MLHGFKRWFRSTRVWKIKEGASGAAGCIFDPLLCQHPPQRLRTQTRRDIEFVSVTSNDELFILRTLLYVLRLGPTLPDVLESHKGSIGP